nr:MAG TPA: hypothetical protein [Caudoviricetes sp.]
MECLKCPYKSDINSCFCFRYLLRTFQISVTIVLDICNDRLRYLWCLF